MKKILNFVILMCASFGFYAIGAEPLIPYKKDKNGMYLNYSKSEMMAIVMSGKANVPKDAYIATAGRQYDNLAKHDGYLEDMSPRAWENEEVFWGIFNDATDDALLDPNQVYRMSAWDPVNKKYTENPRLPYLGERSIRSRPDLYNETLAGATMPYWISMMCGNIILGIYETRPKLNTTPPIPVAARKSPNNDGYTNISKSQTPEIHNHYHYDNSTPSSSTEKVVYVEKQTTDYDYVGYDEPSYYGGYQKPKVTFSVGVLFGNSCCGFGGHSFGYCGHSQPYQQFGYQPAGGGAPQVTNVNVYNNIVNTATATGGTVTVTNPTNPGTPGNPGNPVDPYPGEPGGGGGPVDPYPGGGRVRGGSKIASSKPSNVYQPSNVVNGRPSSQLRNGNGQNINSAPRTTSYSQPSQPRTTSYSPSVQPNVNRGGSGGSLRGISR